MICSAVCLVRFMVESPAQSGRLKTLIHPGPIVGIHVSAFKCELQIFTDLPDLIGGVRTKSLRQKMATECYSPCMLNQDPFLLSLTSNLASQELKIMDRLEDCNESSINF